MELTKKTLSTWMFTIVLGIVLSVFGATNNGYCSFENNWGTSDGDHQIARWLVNSGYYTEAQYNDAVSFARTGFIGHDSGDPDGFFWNLSQPVTFQIMAEESAHQDFSTLGYYTGSGDSKNLTQIFGGLENGPKTLSINQPFGLYLGVWDSLKRYTDRGENTDQSGLLKNIGGDPQALIYELKPGLEWLVAWEDLDVTQGWADKDFNDMYVKVTTNAPEPLSSALFLLGGGTLAFSRLRKKFRSA